MKLSIITLLATLLLSCGELADREQETYEQFFVNLSEQCGNAYPGSLTKEPAGDDMLSGDELLVVHFRECDNDQIKMPFHIQINENEWDRSRTWIFTKQEDGLELRHDHRNADGTEDDVTMYGGYSVEEGTANRQEFKSVPRSEEMGYFRGWRIEIEPGVRYTYGTIRDTTWSWRIDFDLSEPMEETPPAPWGHR